MMNCRKAQKRLVLFAGNDLPERQSLRLRSHLDGCPGCKSELDELERSRESVKKIAQNDLPDALPSDFSQQIGQAITSDQEGSRPSKQKFFRYFQLKPALIMAGILLCFFVAFGPLREILSPGKALPDKFLAEIEQMSPSDNSELDWDSQETVAKVFDGPFSLETWDSPEEGGVYAIMHRSSQENKPNTFVIDYCGHGRNLSLYKGYPWLHQRKKRLIARTGSLQNVYIAVFILPDSSRYERQRIKKAMVKVFNPHFNKGV